jgi:signal transduction histidine kinase
VIRDISERKAAEESLAQASREVQRTNAELETLIYAASHDLKSPMISVLGYLDYLKTDYGDVLGEEGGRYVERMSDCTLYMQRLIHDLIELSRVGRVRADTAELDLEVLVRTIFDEQAPTHPAARFAVRELPLVNGDPVVFRQLFTNLIENALQHGGRDDLTIVVGSAELENGDVELSVADDGQGIPEQYRELVFGIFERLDGPARAEGQGTGMGLAICRKFAEQMGGRIWIGGRVGTDVRVVLSADVVRRRGQRPPLPSISRLHRPARDHREVPA